MRWSRWRILEAVRILGLTEKTRIYQASTGELYGLLWAPQGVFNLLCRLYGTGKQALAELAALAEELIREDIER